MKLSLSCTRLAPLAAFVLAAGFAFAQQPPTKVGIVHIQNAILSTKEGQKAAADLQTRTAPKTKELERKKSEIDALRDQLNKTSSVGSEDAKQKLMREIDGRTKSFNRDVEDAQAEIGQEEQKLLNELGGKMISVLDKYAKDNGYAVILDVSNQQTSNVLFAANGIDVTQDVVALYDKNAPVAAPAAAAPSPAAPAAAPKPIVPKTSAPKPAGAK